MQLWTLFVKKEKTLVNINIEKQQCSAIKLMFFDCVAVLCVCVFLGASESHDINKLL